MSLMSCPNCLALTLELRHTLQENADLTTALKESLQTLLNALEILKKVTNERDQLVRDLTEPSPN